MDACDGCGKGGCTMQCPKCRENGVMIPSKFCSQDCFKANYKKHKQEKHDTSNLNKGRQFLATKRKEEGVMALPSGLLFKRVKEGTGKIAPRVNDGCDVHYRGTLIDGTEFDSSFKRGEPAHFQPNQVIPAWTEALQCMCDGEVWQIYAPFEIAYGPQELDAIPAFSTLVFDIELIAVKGKGRPYTEARAALDKKLGTA